MFQMDQVNAICSNLHYHGNVFWWSVWITSFLIGPAHKGTNHVLKAIADHDLLPDWVRDLNYVRSQTLPPPSWSRTGSAHCAVTFQKCTRTNHVPKEICVHKSSESGFLGRSRSKTPFFRVSKAWLERALHSSQRVKSGFQIRKGSEEFDVLHCEQVLCLHKTLVSSLPAQSYCSHMAWIELPALIHIITSILV